MLDLNVARAVGHHSPETNSINDEERLAARYPPHSHILVTGQTGQTGPGAGGSLSHDP